MADLLTQGVYLYQKPSSYVFNFPSICLFCFPANPFNSSREKNIVGLFAEPPDRWQKPVIRSISCSFLLRLKSNESKTYGDKTVKWMFRYYNSFVTHVSVIFIRENASFIPVLIYQDWHNKLLNTVN